MAWLAGWTYRKAITIAHTDDGAQSDYQVKLLIGESSGAAGEQFDLGGKCLSSFNDLRFTTSDGETLCDYWIESITGATPNQLATVWVEVPAIAAHPNNTIIYCYYGNAGAAAVSSGANTFIKFEDFEWGADGDSLSTSGGSVTWSVTAAGTSKADIDTAQCYNGTRSGRLYRDGTNSPYAFFSVATTSTQAIRFRLRKDDASQFYTYRGDNSSNVLMKVAVNEVISIYDGASYISSGSSATVDAWELYEFNDFNWTDDTVDLWLNGSCIMENADASYATALYNNTFTILNNAGTSEAWIDDIIVRKWTANEPAFSSAGAEESLRALSLKLTAKGYRNLKLTADQYRKLTMTEK